MVLSPRSYRSPPLAFLANPWPRFQAHPQQTNTLRGQPYPVMPGASVDRRSGPNIQFRAAKTNSVMAAVPTQPAVRILNRHTGPSPAGRPASGLADSGGVNVRVLPAAGSSSTAARISTVSPLASVPSRTLPGPRRASVEEVERFDAPPFEQARRGSGDSPRQNAYRQPAQNAAGLSGVSGAKSQPELRAGKPPSGRPGVWAETDLDNGNVIRYERTIKPRGPSTSVSQQSSGE